MTAASCREGLVIEMSHVLVYDTAGYADWPRWTCTTCDATCLRKPYMSMVQWLDKLTEFMVVHPSQELQEYVSDLANWVGV